MTDFATANLAVASFAIQAEALTKNYNKWKRAIDGLSVEIPAGGLVGLIGRNGSGKTTFMKLCAGLLNVTGGSLKVFGQAPMDNLEVLSNLVYSHPGLEYEPSLQLETILRNYARMFLDFDFEFASKLLRYFDLDSGLKYKQLSQGMVSTFNFSCGLACRAKLTLLDEPLLGMDITVRKAAYEILLRDYNEYPRTILLSSHLLAELEGILSDILLIDEGKLVFFCSLDDLRQSAYQLEGDRASLEAFCEGKPLIYRKNGELQSLAVVYEPLDESTKAEAGRWQLRLSAVRVEDLCTYLTRESKEGELACLWEKTN